MVLEMYTQKEFRKHLKKSIGFFIKKRNREKTILRLITLYHKMNAGYYPFLCIILFLPATSVILLTKVDRTNI